MSRLPDFSSHGYQVLKVLGRNSQGGRITYLARRIATQTNLVLKQFQFALAESDWSGFKAYEREIEVLRSLDHPGIPHYLDSFETPTGFCMVQEYKPAQPLASPRSFDPTQIKQIALAILEILVYLQNRVPPVIHRDLKPENILIDENLNVFLVDFGFARIGGNNLAMSTVVAGTPGFMPPEQLLNQRLTPASDLYSLGATLICLIAGLPSSELANLVDSGSFQIQFQPLIPPLSPPFIDWLNTLVQPDPKNRFATADIALNVLKPLDLVPSPNVSPKSALVPALADSLNQPQRVDANAGQLVSPPHVDSLIQAKPVRLPYGFLFLLSLISFGVGILWGGDDIGLDANMLYLGLLTGALTGATVSTFARQQHQPEPQPILASARRAMCKAARWLLWSFFGVTICGALFRFDPFETSATQTFIAVIATILAVGGGLWIVFKESGLGLSQRSKVANIAFGSGIGVAIGVLLIPLSIRLIEVSLEGPAATNVVELLVMIAVISVVLGTLATICFIAVVGAILGTILYSRGLNRNWSLSVCMLTIILLRGVGYTFAIDSHGLAIVPTLLITGLVLYVLWRYLVLKRNQLIVERLQAGQHFQLPAYFSLALLALLYFLSWMGSSPVLEKSNMFYGLLIGVWLGATRGQSKDSPPRTSLQTLRAAVLALGKAGLWVVGSCILVGLLGGALHNVIRNVLWYTNVHKWAIVILVVFGALWIVFNDLRLPLTRENVIIRSSFGAVLGTFLCLFLTPILTQLIDGAWLNIESGPIVDLIQIDGIGRGIGVGIPIAALLGGTVGLVVKNYGNQGWSFLICLFTILLCRTLVYAFNTGFLLSSNPATVLTLLATGMPLAALLQDFNQKPGRLLAQHQQAEQELIEP